MHLEIKSRKAKAGLGREVQSKIGQQLRAIYDDVVNQGVPDKFADLLRQLDEGGEHRRSADPDLPRDGGSAATNAPGRKEAP